MGRAKESRQVRRGRGASLWASGRPSRGGQLTLHPSFEGIWAVMTGSHGAADAEPDKQDDGADQGDKYQKKPPARFVAVMQPPDRNGQTRQKQCQEHNNGQWTALHHAKNHGVDHLRDDTQNHDEQYPKPIFRSYRTWSKVDVIL